MVDDVNVVVAVTVDVAAVVIDVVDLFMFMMLL